MYESYITLNNNIEHLKIEFDENWFKQFMREFNIVVEGNFENYLNNNFNVSFNDIFIFSSRILLECISNGTYDEYDMSKETILNLCVSEKIYIDIEKLFNLDYLNNSLVFLKDDKTKKYFVSFRVSQISSTEIDKMQYEYVDKYNMGFDNLTKQYLNIILKIISNNWISFIDNISNIKLFKILKSNNVAINNVIYGNFVKRNNLDGYKKLKCEFISDTGETNNIVIDIHDVVDKTNKNNYNKLVEYYSAQSKLYLSALNASYDSIIATLNDSFANMNKNIFNSYFNMLKSIRDIGWQIINLEPNKMDVQYCNRLFMNKLRFYNEYKELPNGVVSGNYSNMDFRTLFNIDGLKLFNIMKGKLTQDSILIGYGMHPLFKDINYTQYYDVHRDVEETMTTKIELHEEMNKILKDVNDLKVLLRTIITNNLFNNLTSVDVYEILDETNSDRYNSDIVDVIRILVIGESKTIKEMKNGALRCSISNKKLKDYAKFAYKNYKGLYLPTYRQHLSAYQQNNVRRV